MAISGVASSRTTSEFHDSSAAALSAALASSVRDVTQLRADIVLAAPGSLPNDGKVIDDRRSYA